MNNEDKRLIKVRPKEKQIKWQQLEFLIFFHYGIQSFTEKEREDGTAPVSTFNPRTLDVNEWCWTAKEAGAKGIILAVKQHDGFCLWPSLYTDYSVENSPCNENIVDQVAKNCQRYCLKFGIYISPLDRHEPTYGTGKAYDDFFCNQLRELLDNYGPIFEVWFDGACEESADGNMQVYDWERYYSVVEQYQPSAVIAMCGEDVRWCGSEAGDGRTSEWSVVPASLKDHEKMAAGSQQEGNDSFSGENIKYTDADLGSRSRLEGIEELIWYPSEVNTSIRPSWYYREDEDRKVKTLSELEDLYIRSVGNNSVLLLNVPPHRDGFVTDPDKVRLLEFGDYLKKTFERNFAEQAEMTSEDSEENYNPRDLCYLDESFWIGREGLPCWDIGVDLLKKQTLSYIVLMEQIRLGQRVEKFTVCALTEGAWVDIAQGTTIGYKKICKLEKPVLTRYLRVIIDDARVYPTLRFIGMY